MNDGWKDVPSLDLALQKNGNPIFIDLYTTWFTGSLKLFWPKKTMNLALVLNIEKEDDHKTGDIIKNLWP